MGHVDRERLNRLLGAPELAWVIDRARVRLERGLTLDGVISLSAATPGQRDAAARLLGRRLGSARGLSVSLTDVDAVIRRSGMHPGGLVGAVEVLCGPVAIRADAADAAARAWGKALAPLDQLAANRPALVPWVASVRSTGLLTRLSGGSVAAAGELVAALCAVIGAVPCDPAQSLPAFSARTLGRAHALDQGTAAGTLAVGACRALTGIAAPEPGDSASEARREAWASVGVLCDELSSVVLTLGLPGGAVSGAGLDAARDAGEPAWLTLRQLVRSPPDWGEARWPAAGVLVVENPSVLALAADRFGPGSPPIVCGHGQPRAATIVLLRSLASAGVRVRYHGDFDWPGVMIGNLLCRRVGVEPWRFDTLAYRLAAGHHPRTARLVGTPVQASWDPGLAGAMTEVGRQIEEELVASALLDALTGL